MKVIKAYSLDKKTVEMLEDYCVREEVAFGSNRKGLVSRSKLVNDAIKWFLQGDVAQLVKANENFLAGIKRRQQQLDKIKESRKTNLPWWRRLLLGR